MKDKYTRCRQVLKKLKPSEKNESKTEKRNRFKEWFRSKGSRHYSEFGEWRNYFGDGDERSEEWDLIIDHWNKTNEETKSTHNS